MNNVTCGEDERIDDLQRNGYRIIQKKKGFCFGMDAVLSASISFVVSVIFNYVASMRFVFTRRDDLSRRREFIIFVVLSVVGLVINEIIMAAGVAVLGDSALMITVTKLVATVIVMVWNFFSRKKWLDAGESE